MTSFQKRFISTSICLSLVFSVAGQSWKPAMAGIHPNQPTSTVDHFDVQFKENIDSKDWMYGSYYDEDSIKRVIANRIAGKWVSLPIQFSHGSYATDIEMYGDTLLIGGVFLDIKLDYDSSFYSYGSYLMKWHNDSLWLAPQEIVGVYDMVTKGDSLIIWGGSYYNPPNQVIYDQFMTPDQGQTWQDVFAISHPTYAYNFGAKSRLEIYDDNIYILNNGSQPGNPYRGISRWDGVQWHSCGQGIYGNFGRAFDFEFYQGDVYMGGTFNKWDDANNPGNCIARWDGSQWHSVANGLDNFVMDLFVHDSLLYCQSAGVMFGDANIPHLAAWDGDQWCGTNLGYFSQEPTSFGFANDTLFATFYHETTLNGDTLPILLYFDGDYAKGDSSVCSTYGLSLNENQLGSVEIFPNPSNTIITIRLTSEEIESIKIFDSSGKEVFFVSYDNRLKEQETDISFLPTGVYIVQINNEIVRTIYKL